MEIFSEFVKVAIKDLDALSYSFAFLAGVSLVIATGRKLYIKIRPRFPVQVNCWFCNQNTDVSFSDINSWNCPHCDQYNGFATDGGYNKPIPAQSDELLNHPVAAVKRKPYFSDDNGLCRRCNINQELKIQQLASFIPIDINNFNEEVELYRQRLERAYQLCALCEAKTQGTLSRIGTWIKEKYSSKVQKSVRNNAVDPPSKLFLSLEPVCHLLATTACLLILVLLAASFSPDLVNNLPWISLCRKYESLLTLAPATLLISCVLLEGRWRSDKILTSLVWLLLTILTREVYSISDPDLLHHLLRAKLVLMVASVVILVGIQCEFYCHFAKYLSGKSSATIGPHIKTMPSESNLAGSANLTNSASPQMTDTKAQFVLSSASKPTMGNGQQEIHSELGGLTLGPVTNKIPSPSVFEPRVYQAPDVTRPGSIYGTPYESSPIDEVLGDCWGPRQRKSVLKPAKLQLNKLSNSSWVAGGYWQNSFATPSLFPTHSYAPSVNFPMSRSSSQSSGFISQGGTNFSSVPNSVAGSVCDGDRFSVLSEPAYSPSALPYSNSSPPAVTSYCCYVAAPQPGTTFVFPHPGMMPRVPPPVLPDEDFSETATDDKSVKHRSIIKAKKLHQKPLATVVRENFVLSTLLFASLVFNAVVIALAVVNSLQLR